MKERPKLNGADNIQKKSRKSHARAGIPMPWALEEEAKQAGFDLVAGVDEAGRGPLAGPVVAAAVILPAGFDIAGVRDSKTLSPEARERLFDRITEGAAAVGVGLCDHAEIDRMNILRASLLSMSRAVDALCVRPGFLIVDGKFKAPLDIPQRAVIRGDALCVSVAAASIVAKVTRDRMMEDFDRRYPGYGFCRHKGYGTAEHLAALSARGPCPIHRLSFKRVLPDPIFP